jgi:tetratricopeptide (TPR) repeat protein
MKRMVPQAGAVHSTEDPARGEVALPLAAPGTPQSGVQNPTKNSFSFRFLTPRRVLTAVALLGILGVAGALSYPHVRAWRHLSAARSALKKYHNLEAIRHLQVCLKTWPTDAEVLFLAARTARRAGAYGEAEQALEKYEDQRGSDEAVAVERILLRAENGELDQVGGFCRHWIEHGHPDATFIFEASVRGYLQAYRLSDARLCLQRWREEEPDNPQPYYLEGQIHDCEGVSWAAVEAYQKVLQADPEHDEARLKLTAALLERRAFAEAVPHLEYLRQHQPDEPLVPVRLALCRNFLGEPDEAVRLLDELLARHPHFAPALVERGKLALARGEYDTAEVWLREAVALAPGEHETRYQLVQCLRRGGKEAEAQQQEQRLKRLEIDLRRISEIANLRMSETPSDPGLHGELGAIMLRNGFIEQGLHWLNSALKLDARCSQAHQALGEYYQQLGDAEKAENHRRLAAASGSAGAKSGKSRQNP